MDATLPAPKQALEPGDSIPVQSLTSDKTYTIKREQDTYVCSCPAWKIQKNPINARTCKHLKEVLGVEYEQARLARGGGAWTTSKAEDAKAKKKGKVVAAGGGGSSKGAGAGAGAGTKRKKLEEEVEDEGEEVEEVDNAGENKKGVKVLLANKFEVGGKVDPKGWWMSEKLDGIRAYWDGQGSLWSRLGNRFHAPKWFTDDLPQGHTLDGELFHSRNNFNLTTSIVRSHGEENWEQLKYQVFDIPSHAQHPFERRLEILHELFPSPSPTPHAASTSKAKDIVGVSKTSVVEIVLHSQCEGMHHLAATLKEVEQGGGEGLMLRQPKSLYVGSRSSTLLKCKSFFDAEAVVTGYEKGKGKYKGMTGSLVCEMESGQRFSCGSGLTDAQRSNPPAIGSIIQYRFQEMTKDNVPRFPTFVGERIDMDAPKDADVTSKNANAVAGPVKKKTKKTTTTE